MGTLYYSDNLDILRRYLKDELVSLVYLRPAFRFRAILSFNLRLIRHQNE